MQRPPVVLTEISRPSTQESPLAHRENLERQHREKLFPTTYSTENTLVPCGHLCVCDGYLRKPGSHHIGTDDRMVRMYFLLSKWERASHGTNATVDRRSRQQI